MLSTEEAFGVIDQICEVGKPIVVLSGGEPLMREDIFDIARYGTEKGLRMVMGTSGILIDQTKAAQLREAGIKSVAISLYSTNPAIHDSFRGKQGMWEKAILAIQNCREEGVDIQINMSILRSDIIP